MNTRNLALTMYGVLKARFFGRYQPVNVMLSLTDRCPSQCTYCAISSRAKKELGTADLFTLIDQITAMGCQRLGLWGGEPLLRDDIKEVVGYAKDKGLFVTMDSNGYLLPEKIHLLKRLDHLVLAFDGDQKAHDANREPGSFAKARAAIEAARGRIPFWSLTVLTKNNLDSVDYILDTARTYGFLAAFQLLHHNDILGKNKAALLPPADAYRKVIRKLIAEKKKGAPIASSRKYLEHILQWQDYQAAVSRSAVNRLACWAGKLYCNVDTDGAVYKCSLSIGKNGAHNFLESGFKSAFHALQNDDCRGCMASCFTEYNYLYSLDPGTILHWVRSLRRTRCSR
jgi:MoaA/NifB/PqqE/SkfB family radical SAM enzyme